ncbi:MAG: hypothetical protein M3134_10730 [Actinomycetota bacterium]|nr:hypothetical protein [Actinomycetota bacterium]
MKKTIAILALAIMPLTAAPAGAAESNLKQKVECMFYTYIQEADPMDCLT